MSKAIEIDNKKWNVSIWDTMGTERFRSTTKSLIKGSNIIIFVYDITKRDTFLELNYWFNATNEKLGRNEVIFGVAGNKVDLFTDSEVETTEEEEYAEKKLNGLFCETSAKANPLGFKNFIKLLLERLVSNQEMLEQLENTNKEKRSSRISLNPEDIPKKKQGKCCK